MSEDKYFTIVPNSIIRNKNLTPHEKAVLIVLLSYANCKNIYLAQDRIANESSMKRDTVQRVIKRLKEKGYIATKSQGRCRSLLYKIIDKKRTDEDRTPYGLNKAQPTDVISTSIKKKKKNIKRKEASVKITDRKGGKKSIKSVMDNLIANKNINKGKGSI